MRSIIRVAVPIALVGVLTACSAVAHGDAAKEQPVSVETIETLSNYSNMYRLHLANGDRCYFMPGALNQGPALSCMSP